MLRPGQEFGGYRIVRRIGQGAMGEVYEADQLDLQRRVALKVLAGHLGEEPQFRDRFRREATLLARVDSPHIITVHAHGETEGRLWIATQLVQGGDLKGLIGEHGLPVPVALDLLSQVCGGLADAHEAGLLHRDIKPSNVLVRDRSGQLHAYLCDFGIARAADDDRTQTGGVMGTLAYMAPERHQGSEATVASDVYAIGCVLWAALTGRAPYAGTTEVEVALGHIQRPAPSLPAHFPGAAGLNRILAGTLAKEPRQRYQDVRQLQADLSALRAAVSGTATDEQPTLASSTVPRPAGVSTDASMPGTGTGSVGSTAELRPSHSRRTGQLALVSAAVVAATVGTLFAVVQLGWADRGADARSDAATSPSVTKDETGAEDATSPQARPEKKGVSANASSTSEASATPPPRAPATSPSPRPVTCWDGSRQDLASSCSTPTGRLGMATVFPDLGAGCTKQNAVVGGKAEVYTCEYDGFLLRYTRWAPEVDRDEYYRRANPGAATEPWLIQTEVAGTSWTSYEEEEAERGEQPWQWSATYAEHPFSVSVEGTTAANRARGIAAVHAAHPSAIGLAQAPDAG